MYIGKRRIGNKCKTYFIADIGANHDGNLSRAKKLIKLAKKAGADAAKFQHFSANTIVSDKGFKNLKGNKTHQDKWRKSIFEVYKSASINKNWTKILANYCKKIGIEFMTSPYSINIVDEINPYVNAIKIGSGDLTWTDILKKIASKNKVTILATGASELKEVILAVKTIIKKNKKLVLMQCNTNYTGDHDNIDFTNLNVLKKYKELFPNVILGLSDHTFGHTSVLGAVAYGAKVIEKHFTDNNKRSGPDHFFAMNPRTWKLMVEETRKLERALGNGKKKIEKNELTTVIVQRRSIRAGRSLPKGTIIKENMLSYLRPCPAKSLAPSSKNKIINKRLKKDKKFHDVITLSDVT